MESGIQETFARGIRNLKNICSWKLTGIEKIFARGIRNLENICPWNPESRKYFISWYLFLIEIIFCLLFLNI